MLGEIPPPFLHPLSLGQVQCPVSPHCSQCVMMVHCLLFNFAGQFNFGCCSLAQEIISVIPLSVLLWGVAYCPPTLALLLSSVCLLIVHAEISSLLSPFRCTFSISAPLCCCARLLFTVVQFFLGGRGTLLRGSADLSWGWLGEFHMKCGAHLFGLSNGQFGASSSSCGGGGSSQVFSV
jgi:hypothetical protein